MFKKIREKFNNIMYGIIKIQCQCDKIIHLLEALALSVARVKVDTDSVQLSILESQYKQLIGFSYNVMDHGICIDVGIIKSFGLIKKCYYDLESSSFITKYDEYLVIQLDDSSTKVVTLTQ